jgi:hypothetical protein
LKLKQLSLFAIARKAGRKPNAFQSAESLALSTLHIWSEVPV